MRTTAEVDLGAVGHNVGVVRAAAGQAAVVAVVKANGYGHGAVPVAAASLDAGAAALAVATVGEGVELRDAGIDARILVLSEPPTADVGACAAFALEPAVFSPEGIAGCASAARAHGHPLTVHLKVDTGMHRIGAHPDRATDLAASVVTDPALTLGSVWTHCPVADDPDDGGYTEGQLERFAAVVWGIRSAGIHPPWVHAANSGATFLHPASHLEAVRCGIALYGLAPSPALASHPGVADLQPALTWRSVVTHVQVLAAGDAASYGRVRAVDADTVVATVPVGYADGVRRNLHREGALLVGGRRRRILGVVTMDQVMVECGPPSGRTDADGPVPVRGDEVVVLGRQGAASVTADDWASWLGTINYEIVCGIGQRVPRTYVGGSE